MKHDFMRFAEEVRSQIEKVTGEDVRLHPVKKNNGVVLHGITILTSESKVSPTIYIDKWFREYEEGEAIEDIADEIIRLNDESAHPKEIDISFFSNYEEVKKNLAYKLINADMNVQLLQEVPHKRFLNLAVVCFCEIRDEIIGDGSILIKNEHLKLWGLDDSVLIQDAMENAQKTIEADFFNIIEVLKERYRNPENMIDVEYPMWVLTNKRRLYGAGVLLYDNQLEQIAEKVQSDFIILPSSVHEVLVTPMLKNNIDYLVSMVREINKEQLILEERLADSVYIYHRETKSLEMVS